MGKKGKLQPSYFTFSRKTFFNKYFIVTACFLVWLTFFDKNGMSTNYKLGKAIDKLESTKKDYETKIVEARIQRKDMEENKEKFARERYLMHKENEDVIIIENKK